MSKHTPEPWAYDIAYGIYVDNGFDGPDRLFLTDWTGPNAERAVECVNACEGIENPAGISELIKATLAMAAHINATESADFRGDAYWQRRGEVCLRLSEALATLGVK